MSKFISCINQIEEWVNLDRVDHIYIEDMGKDYPKPYRVVARMGTTEVIMGCFKEEKHAMEWVEDFTGD